MLGCRSLDYVIDPAIVSVDRDVWDWFLYVASLLAAVTAVVLFLPWALERRRRPEVRYAFRISDTGRPEDLRDWFHQDLIRVHARQTVLVETAIQNVGDKPGELTLLNFVVPDIFTLEMDGSTTVKATKTKNFTAGLPPNWAIVYCAPGASTWTPGNWYVARYRLTAEPEHVTSGPLDARLLLTVSDPGFNRSGQRWVPSIPPPVEPLTAHAGQPWPPGRRRGPLEPAAARAARQGRAV